jgi:hypothetical protein
MANSTIKPANNLSQENILRASANDHDGSLNVNGYLAGKVGRKIQQTIATTTVAGDTAILDFLEDGILLYQYTIIYTTAGQSVMISAERTA